MMPCTESTSVIVIVTDCPSRIGVPSGRYASAFAGTLNAANTVESCPWPDARARKYIFTTVSRPLVAVNVITGLAMDGAVEAMFRKLGSSSPAMSRCAALGTPNPERGCEALGAVASLAQAARPVSTDAAAARASSSRREEFIEVAPKQYIERGGDHRARSPMNSGCTGPVPGAANRAASL